MRRIADRINGDQKAKEGNLSRRADGKLDTVAEGMRKAVGSACTGVEKDFLERTVLLDGFTLSSEAAPGLPPRKPPSLHLL